VVTCTHKRSKPCCTTRRIIPIADCGDG
jgi:hypothetical protein